MTERRPSKVLPRVASRIKAEMRRRRMTNRHLAFRAGLDERTVRNVVGGAVDVRLGTLEAIVAVLGLDLATVLATTTDSPPSTL